MDENIQWHGARWIPITEKLPPLYVKVLLTVKEPVYSLEKGFHEETYVICRAWNGKTDKVLAWMPLPLPYKEATDEADS